MNTTIPVKWEEVICQSNVFKWLSDVDIALKTSIKGLHKSYQIEGYEAELNHLCKTMKMIEPREGIMSEFVENSVLTALASIGFENVFVSDEFNEEVERVKISKMLDGFLVHVAGNIYDEGNSFLLTTHWDSHFSFLCGKRSFVESVIEMTALEGFFCDEETEVFWSNRNGN